MNIAGWILAPLKTLLAILHTAVCSITGLIAMALSAHNGDWVMWRVGRQMWSRPLLQAILGAKLDINVHPEAQALADRQQGVVLGIPWREWVINQIAGRAPCTEKAHLPPI